MTRILLVHGLGSEPDTFDAVIEPLRARLPAAELQRPRLGDRFAEAVDLVGRWMAGGPGVVVGHSMGGQVTMSAARRVGGGHPLVLLAPGGLGPRPDPRVVWSIWGREVLRGRGPDAYEAAMRMLYADPGHPWADRRAAAHRARAGSAEGERWIERVVTQVEGVLAGWLGEPVDIPGTLRIACGARDPLVDPRILEGFARRHPRAVFERWQGVGHMLPDEAPDRVAELIAQAAATG